MQRDSSHHRIHVTDDGAWRVMRFEHNQQSSMALDDPFESSIEYVDYLHLTLAINPDPQRVLVIGLGGGSLVKRMWRDYPDVSIDAVEIDPVVAQLARTHFALPDDERISVFVGDGREFVETTLETYDIVVIDAFDDDRVPRHLTTEEFMRAVRDRLSPGGVVAYNFIGALAGPRSKPFRSLHRTASNVWRHQWVFPIDFASKPAEKHFNIVFLATDVELAADELLDRIASRVEGRVTVRGFEQFGEDLYRGSVRTGDVPLLLDEAPRKR